MGGPDEAINHSKKFRFPFFRPQRFHFNIRMMVLINFQVKNGDIYTRMGNPTIKAIENCIASSENGFRGLATASGMAAVTTLI